MIKWEKPMLISLSGATEARGDCAPTGSGVSGDCTTGNSASLKCLSGNAPDNGDCGVGTSAANWCDSGSSAGNCIGGSDTT